MKFLNKYIFILSFNLLFLLACDQEEVIDRVFKNYLANEINVAEDLLNNTTAGDQEGEFSTDARDFLQQEINLATNVLTQTNISQERLDLAYVDLQQAQLTYQDLMIPFRSAYYALYEEAEEILAVTEEGTTEGTVPPGSKQTLQNVMDSTLILVEDTNLSQSQLNEILDVLNKALLTYEGSILGAFQVPVLNASFEEPAQETDDISLVTGWDVFQIPYDWSPQVFTQQDGGESLPANSTPDGSFVISIGSYTGGIWQQLNEKVKGGVTYTLSLQASIRDSKDNWEGNAYETLVRSRLIVFNGEIGNYDDITILSEKDHSLGIEQNIDEFMNFQHSYTVSADHEHIGKPIVIDFMSREAPWGEQNWSETFIFLDHIKLSRQSN